MSGTNFRRGGCRVTVGEERQQADWWAGAARCEGGEKRAGRGALPAAMEGMEN